jgi:indoleamine 2,3-dioxygenase
MSEVTKWDHGFLPSKCCHDFPEEVKYLDIFLDLKQYDPEAFRTAVSYHSLTKSTQHLIRDNIMNKIWDKYQIQYIYSMTSILAHKYIWGVDDDYKCAVPVGIAIPWFYSAKALDIPPVLTHATVDLYNWQLINPEAPFTLDNLRNMHLMTDTPEQRQSESWFYLIMTAIEGCCGEILPLSLETLDLLEEYSNPKKSTTKSKANSLDKIKGNLIKYASLLSLQRDIITRLPEKCVPHLFFNTQRKYLWGSDSDKLGGEVMLDGDFPNESQTISFGGGSAAQSSLIQVEDIFLGVKHPGDKFLMKQREYMPGEHRRILETMSLKQSLKHYIDRDIIKDDEIIELFNECLQKLVTFRGVHMGIVKNYIIQQVQVNDARKKGITVGELEQQQRDGVKGVGTGGTDLKTFLNGIKQDTENAMVE